VGWHRYPVDLAERFDECDPLERLSDAPSFHFQKDPANHLNDRGIVFRFEDCD